MIRVVRMTEQQGEQKKKRPMLKAQGGVPSRTGGPDSTYDLRIQSLPGAHRALHRLVLHCVFSGLMD